MEISRHIIALITNSSVFNGQTMNNKTTKYCTVITDVTDDVTVITRLRHNVILRKRRQNNSSRLQKPCCL